MDKQKIHPLISRGLHKLLKLEAVELDLSMNQLMEKILTDYFGKRKGAE